MKKVYMVIGIVFLISLLFAIPFMYESMSQKSAGSELLSVKTSPERAVATFAGGCFWCMEPPFEKLDGVYAVTSGYTGGEEVNPTYEEVAGKKTGHVEAVLIEYNPQLISYEELLQVFWRQIDPTDDGGQFVDRGSPYRTAIFYHDEEQRKLALQSKADLQASGRFKGELVTRVEKAQPFYRAEEYHQDYYEKNPVRYEFYRSRSGRDDFLEDVWGDEREVRN